MKANHNCQVLVCGSACSVIKDRCSNNESKSQLRKRDKKQ